MFGSVQVLRKLFGLTVTKCPKNQRSFRLNLEGFEERVVPAVVTVSGKANIYGAGLAAPPAPGGGGGGVMPTLVNLVSLGNPTRVSFPEVTGKVSGWAAAGGYNGPDGGGAWGGVTKVPAWKGISGVRHDSKTMFLVGVFLGPNGQPSVPPTRLIVTDANSVATTQPLIGQQFFVGDGYTSSRDLQSVIVPTGATRLFLGFAENFEFRYPERLPGYYNDNGGSLSVNVQAAATNSNVSVTEGVAVVGAPQSQSFHISTGGNLAPTMPTLKFALRDLPVGVVPSALAVTWTTSVNYGVGVNTPPGAKSIPGFTFSVTQFGTQYQPVFPSVRGGELDVTARFTHAGVNYTVSSESSFNTRSLRILGSNPTKAQVQSYINSFPVPSHWPVNTGTTYHSILRRIAFHETDITTMGSGGYNQFYRTGTFAGQPAWNTGGDGGVGIMQVTTNPISAPNVWDWRANVAAGVAIFNDKLRIAATYPQTIKTFSSFTAAVAKVNQIRVSQGLQPLLRVDVPAWTPEQRLRVAIRAYNGAAGIDSIGTRILHEFELAMTGTGSTRRLALSINETTRVGTASWVRVLIARRTAGEPNYVNRVLDSSDL